MSLTHYLQKKHNLDNSQYIKISHLMTELHITMIEALTLVTVFTDNPNRQRIEIRFDLFCYIIETELT